MWQGGIVYTAKIIKKKIIIRPTDDGMVTQKRKPAVQLKTMRHTYWRSRDVTGARDMAYLLYMD